VTGYTRELVERVAAHLFGAEASGDVMDILDHYPDEGSEAGRARVQLAILKLSRGDPEKLPDLVAQAWSDFRDVLGAAEYPEQMRLPAWQLREEEGSAAAQRDLAQYRAWLTSVGANEVEPVA